MMKRHLVLLLLVLINLVGCTTTTQESNNEIAEPSIDNVPRVEHKAENDSTIQNLITGDFAIRNIETSKNIRPYNAGTSDGNKIILYPHNEWKCLTWQFNHIDGTIYQLQNVYTQKTFEPVSAAEKGVALWQQPLNEYSPKWEFLEQQEGVYAIRLVDTDLYITISSVKTDESIILMPYDNLSTQHWELIEQYPLV